MPDISIKEAISVINKYPHLDDYLQAVNCVVKRNAFIEFKGDINKSVIYWYNCYNIVRIN